MGGECLGQMPGGIVHGEIFIGGMCGGKCLDTHAMMQECKSLHAAVMICANCRPVQHTHTQLLTSY